MLEIATTKDFSYCTVCTLPLCKESELGRLERMSITWRKIHNNKCLRAVRTEDQISQFCRWPSISVFLLKESLSLSQTSCYFHIFYVTELGFPCYRTVFSPRERLLKGLCNPTEKWEMRGSLRDVQTQLRDKKIYFLPHQYRPSHCNFSDRKFKQISTFTWPKKCILPWNQFPDNYTIFF